MQTCRVCGPEASGTTLIGVVVKAHSAETRRPGTAPESERIHAKVRRAQRVVKAARDQLQRSHQLSAGRWRATMSISVRPLRRPPS